MTSITLKPGREKSILRRHPWVFSGAVADVKGNPSQGETVELRSHTGQSLGLAAYSPSSQIRARIWTFDASDTVDEAFFHKRVQACLDTRRRLNLAAGTDAYRLIHAESDALPGVIADRYGELIVVQFLSAGAEQWRETIAQVLSDQTGVRTIYERSDADVRALEGLPVRCGTICGTLPEPPICLHENGLEFEVDIVKGHKTGFYLDQRDNRLQVRHLSEGRDVLDCFCYTGGFTVNALAGGATSVLSVDASDQALTLCRENVTRNHPDGSPHAVLEGDVFQLLRKFRDEGRSFDLIVLDPPKFAPTAAQAEKAARGYKDINLLGFKLLRRGGVLVTFSCSGGVDAAFFQKIIAAAALDAGVEAQITGYLAQAPDHPVALNFPEGAYLKGLVCLKS